MEEEHTLDDAREDNEPENEDHIPSRNLKEEKQLQVQNPQFVLTNRQRLQRAQSPTLAYQASASAVASVASSQEEKVEQEQAEQTDQTNQSN